MEQRLDALFKKKREKNIVEKFRGRMRGRRSASGQSTTQPQAATTTPAATTTAPVGSLFYTGESATPKWVKTKPYYFGKEFGFRFPVTSKSMATGNGWYNLFNIIFYCIPAVIMYIANKIAYMEILRTDHDTKDGAKYNEYREMDKFWIYNAGVEFCQIFVAAWFASALYHTMYIAQRPSLEIVLKKADETSGFAFSFLTSFWTALAGQFSLINQIPYVTLLSYDSLKAKLEANAKKEEKANEIDVTQEVLTKTVGYFAKTAGLFPVNSVDVKNVESSNMPQESTSQGVNVKEEVAEPVIVSNMLPLKEYRTLVYLVLYCISFFVCSFLLSRIANLFLDVFLFKAHPIMYLFICIGLLNFFLSLIESAYYKIKYAFDKPTINLPNPQIASKLNLFYLLYIIIHFILAMLGAPIAQALTVLYLFSFFMYEGYQNRFFIESPVQKDLEELNNENPSDLNNFFHSKFLKNNGIMFLFLLTVFFFYKCLTSMLPIRGYGLKIFSLGISLIFFNFILFILFAYVWSLYAFPVVAARDVGLKGLLAVRAESPSGVSAIF